MVHGEILQLFQYHFQAQSKNKFNASSKPVELLLHKEGILIFNSLNYNVETKGMSSGQQTDIAGIEYLKRFVI